MREQTAALRAPLRVRLGRALRQPAHWLQLGRFTVVGASGYALNIGVFATAHRGLGMEYHLAALVAFLAAVTNNFGWNRRWTFRGADGRARVHALRFLAVSVAAFAFNLVVLDALVELAGLAPLPSQALAVMSATPLSFLGNKLWTFRP